jgi:hypothetical protein
MIPIKSFTNMRPNDGLQISFGVPLSQRFQCAATFNFSNKEEAEFELQSTYLGAGSQMDEDIGLIMAQTSSGGRLAIQGQTKLPLDLKSFFQLEMASPDPNQTHVGFNLQKDFDGCHL